MGLNEKGWSLLKRLKLTNLDQEDPISSVSRGAIQHMCEYIHVVLLKILYVMRRY
jgi:hypothetical protein